MAVPRDLLASSAERQIAIVRQRCSAATRSFVEFPRDATERSVPERIESVASLHAARVAVDGGDHILTYHDLNLLANRLARAIVERLGAQSEPVAFLLDQGSAPIVAILGILKAGKMYVTLDTVQPSPRLSQLLEDSQARLIVTNRPNVPRVHELCMLCSRSIGILQLEDLGDDVSGANLDLAIPPDQPAAIFYTSGTTGRPKGVIQTHRNVLHRTMADTNCLRLCCDDREPQLFSYGVVLSLVTFDMLLNGGTVVPCDLKRIGAARLADWLIANRITVLTLTAAHFRQLIEALPGADEQRFPQIRVIGVTGEPIARRDIALWHEHFPPHSVFAYWMGCTETLRVAHVFLDKQVPIPQEPIPVGYPGADKEIILVDDSGLPVAQGQEGEIVVKSKYLSPGYWRQPELTERAFRNDEQRAGQRRYFTGDLGRFREDGTLELLGRKDFQVKIRGHTIQPGAVETALLDTTMLKEVVVVAHHGSYGSQRLVAYLVTEPCPEPTVHELRQALKDKLPNYMIPSAFVYLDALPRTANGKVDRRALPAPERRRPGLGTPFAAPRSELETRLAKVWAEMLELDEVGVHDDFFELGGDSLLAVRMILEVEQLASGPVPQEYFRDPTIAALAQHLESSALPVAGARDQAPYRPVKDIDARSTDQGIATRVARKVVREVFVRLSYGQGIAWLRWIGQPAVANWLYRDERECFRSVAASLGNTSAATARAFQASVVGNVVRGCIGELRSTSGPKARGLFDVMRASRHRFWRSFADMVERAASDVDDRTGLIEIDGLGHLYQGLKSRRGVILLTYHSPAMPIATALLSHVTNLAITTISQETARWMARRQRHDEGDCREERERAWSATFALACQRILKQGGVVQIINDVSYDDSNAIRKSIGGRLYDLKPGFAELARITGATVLPVQTAYGPAGIHVNFLPALRPSSASAGPGECADDMLDQYVAFLEDTWRRMPESMGWGSMKRFCTRPVVGDAAAEGPFEPR